MNIIYMHTHDTGRYIQPYGYQVPTPNLMELARQGIVFRNAYCAAPTCSPSRAALLTGMNPHSVGMLGLAHRGFQLKDYEQHLVRFLNRHGFETVLCGEQHEAPYTEMIGYQRILDPDNEKLQNPVAPEGDKELSQSERDLLNASRVARYLKQQPRDKPFFLSFGMVNTHREYPTEHSVNPDYVRPPFPLPDTAKTREDMAAYIASAEVVDRCVGIVMDALCQSGLEDHTVVIFTTDHGIAFPRMKCSLYDPGIGVALLMKLPQEPGRKVSDALVSHLDLFPTICDLTGLEKPDWLEGSSLYPLLTGEVDEIRSHLFAEVTFHAAYEPMRCVRTQRHKLIRRFDAHNSIIPANIDDSPSKDLLMEHGLLEESSEREMLFDLYFDPVERVNLTGDPRYQEVYSELSGMLREWMINTNDPLLQGKVSRPPGAVVNKVTCISPEEEDFE